MDRITWNDVWSQFAAIIAQRSYDPRTKVGAVIVTEDNTQVLAVGYNGGIRGGDNQVDSLEPGKSGLIHAEVNALIKLDYNNPKKKKMYLTLSPCESCAKLILNSNIDQVFYLEEYRDLSGLTLLQKFGLKTTKL